MHVSICSDKEGTGPSSGADYRSNSEGILAVNDKSCIHSFYLKTKTALLSVKETLVDNKANELRRVHAEVLGSLVWTERESLTTDYHRDGAGAVRLSSGEPVDVCCGSA